MTGCRRGCLHRQLVTDYRVARHAAELARESATMGWPAEEAEYDAQHPRTTFRAWLEGHRSNRED